MARRLAAAFHTCCGKVAFRFGGIEVARRHFERVLSLGGDEFTSFVHLGRIALGDGDFAGYRREMANARACDPERFARLRPPVEGLEPRLNGSPFDETGERATWRSVRPNGSILRRTAVHSAEVPLDGLGDANGSEAAANEAGGSDVGDSDTQRNEGEAAQRDDSNATGAGTYSNEPYGNERIARCDDFLSAAERAQFRVRPPIRGDEVRATDLDELARRLTG